MLTYSEVQGKEIANFCACSTSVVFHKISRPEAWRSKKLLAIVSLKYSCQKINVYQSHMCFICNFLTLHVFSDDLKRLGAETFLKQLREITERKDVTAAEFWEQFFKNLRK